MRASDTEMLLEGIRLALVGMGMVGFFLSFLVLIITVSSRMYLKQSDNCSDADTVAAISIAIMKFRESTKL